MNSLTLLRQTVNSIGDLKRLIVELEATIPKVDLDTIYLSHETEIVVKSVTLTDESMVVNADIW